MASIFNAGDVVELKSGSPKMTIVISGSDGQYVWCTWYDFSKSEWRENIKFPTVALKISS